MDSDEDSSGSDYFVEDSDDSVKDKEFLPTDDEVISETSEV